MALRIGLTRCILAAALLLLLLLPTADGRTLSSSTLRAKPALAAPAKALLLSLPNKRSVAKGKWFTLPGRNRASSCAWNGSWWAPGLFVAKRKAGAITFVDYATLVTYYAKHHEPALSARYKKLSKDLTATCKAAAAKQHPAGGRTVRWLPKPRQRVSCASSSTPAAHELRFAVCGKIAVVRNGVARRSIAAADAGSGVSTLDANAAATDAVSSGTAAVGTFTVGPTGLSYVAFATPVNLADTTATDNLCSFAVIDEATGITTCIDTTISGVTDVQFDNAGRVYYRGTVGAGNATSNPTSSLTTLRRYADGVVANLTTSSSSITAYVALDDGTVVMSGKTTATGGQGWVRWVDASNTLHTIFPNDGATWLKEFPDGNVYMGMWGGMASVQGVWRFLAATHALDPIPWLQNQSNNATLGSVYFDTGIGGLCPTNARGELQHYQFCGWSGSQVTELRVSQGGVVFALAGSPNQGSILMEYWPEVRDATTQVTNIQHLVAAGSFFVLGGTTDVGQNVVTAYDPATDTERVLMIGGDETEVYHLAYSAATDEVYFDGLRFSTNAYVFGKVVVASGAVTYLGTTSMSFSDFQSF